MLEIHSQKIYTYSLFLIFFIWLILLNNLLITDVWDETAGLLIISKNYMPSIIYENIHGSLEQLIYRRPLAGFLVYSVLKLPLDYDVLWKLLRLINAGFILLSVYFFIKVFKFYKGEQFLSQLLIIILLLFSGSTIITIGWYANIYDASALFLLSLGIYLLLIKNMEKSSAIAIGLAFFCKETSLLIYILLALFFFTRMINKKQIITVLSISFLFGLVYFFIRNTFIPLGSSSDIHGFNLELLIPSLSGFFESFWWQQMKYEKLKYLGWLFLLISLISIKNRIAMVSAVGILILSGLMYWEMTTSYQHDEVITFKNFIGRLYLIPFYFILLIIAVFGNNKVLLILAVPILAGGFLTYNNHYKFQHSYLNMYNMEHGDIQDILYFKQEGLGVVIHDPERRIKYGNLKSYQFILDIKTGLILKNSSLKIDSR